MLHILGLPHTQISEKFSPCAFTKKIINFIKILDMLGYEYRVYSTGESTDKIISCMDMETRQRIYKGNKGQVMFDRDNNEGRSIFDKNCIEQINAIKQPGDLLINTYGLRHETIMTGTGIPTMELGIGYIGACPNTYRVFESYAWMNYLYGRWNRPNNPCDYDCVIPNYYDLSQFTYEPNKEDYIFFIGRLNNDKGPQVAVDVAKKLGIRIKVAGQKGGWDIDPYCEYVGVVGIEERNELMGKAKAVMMPTLYVEPFGGVTVEALLCGTPVISSDNGGQQEVNEHGKTGFRCRSFNEYVNALEKIDTIDPAYCRKYAEEKYSLASIAPLYKKQIDKVLNLINGGGDRYTVK